MEWKRLLSDYFRDNYLIGEYLGASPEAVRQARPEAMTQVIRTTGLISEVISTFNLHRLLRCKQILEGLTV